MDRTLTVANGRNAWGAGSTGEERQEAEPKIANLIAEAANSGSA